MRRNKVLQVGLLLATGVIVARLFFIQILEHDFWSEKAEAQQTLSNTIVAKRGEVYMMDGDEPTAVVMNATVYTVVVDPMLANRENLEEKLGGILQGEKAVNWDEVFKNRALRYYVVARDVERARAEEIAEANLVGVWLQSGTKRVYPEGQLGSAFLGFVNTEGKGQYGIEGAMNEQLAGKDGMLKTVKDVNNVALSIGDDNIKTPAVDGENVVLTVDKNMQYNVEKIIEKKAHELGFANVSALVMDPNTGEILTMADIPGYDPGEYGKVTDARVFVNHTVEDSFEPASVCKTFTFATAVDNGLMTAETKFLNNGETYVDGWPIKNAEQGSYLLGMQTMQTAFNYSLNTGSTQALRWLGGDQNNINAAGRERLYEYYHDRFGLGQETGVELYESTGLLIEPNAEHYGLDSTYANMTFGQNMQASMVQVAAAFSSVVNGGEYYTPTIVAGKMENGEFVKKERQKPLRNTISQETSATMRDMLHNTRRAWRNTGLDKEGYYVGGKTGTAQVIRDGAYSFDETIATYIGFGGQAGELPQYVIMVRIWEDGKVAGGQAHALPVFNEVNEYVQSYLRIQPKLE